MQPKEIVRELLPLVGGKENIVSSTHCASRLRLFLHDEEKADMAAIENIEGVEGVVFRGGQMQIIFGSGRVNRIYRALVAEDMISPTVTPEMEPPQDLALRQEEKPRKMPAFARLIQTISNIFVPIIPAIVASGLLMGLIGMVKAFHWIAPGSAWMSMLQIFSSSSFIILPILIGYSAAREFGGNPYLGAVVGGILTHPSLLNPTELGSRVPDTMNLFGYVVPLIGYQGTVIPMLLSVYVMSQVEKGLRRFVPTSLDLLVIPFVTVMFTACISLVAIGPVGLYFGSLITSGLEYVYHYGGFLAGFLFGGLYALFVITGLHHSLHAIEAELLADPTVGANFLLPIWSMANVAQGGAALAVYFKTKSKRLRKIAIPAALSSFLGIIEPVIFGINLRLVRPFIGAAIGGGLGGAYVVFTHVLANSYGLTGIPMIAIVAPLGLLNITHYLTGFAISVIGAFLATWMLGMKDEEID
ncbi:sucrose-specific PTS transporter subunit IIBC [Brevibacillus migulae]|uniref:sucrose-specific PTS transporter subunit IIBC n=1 Tax=Brevibacillus migulae TaxID=1644114 RepID=UPI00106DF516|nr:sucrose-specific PTS transporter subunit IIBC [Brevibacillus migulae]